MIHNGLLFLALVAAQTQAREAPQGWGGSIVIIDASSGMISKDIPEPRMYHVYNIGAGTNGQALRISWTDVPDSAKKTDDSPINSKLLIARRLDISLPSFSTHTATSTDRWSDIQLTPLKPIDSNEAHGKIPIPWNRRWGNIILLKKNFIVPRGGEGLDCYDLSSGIKLWSSDLNPLNSSLPGPDPELKVFMVGNELVAATDRLGLYAIDVKNGRVLWHVSYSNADIVPILGTWKNYLVLAPVSR